jgi:hypothetical protein
MLSFLPGILLGVSAACCFSVAYLGSRVFYEKSARGPLHLLAISYIQMGVFAACLLPFIWSKNPFSWAISLPLFGTVFFGMFGQLVFFLTLKYANPSQVTPLLALKILILAFGSVLLLHKHLSLLQWVSVVICFTAALVLNFSGKAIPSRALLGILVVCCVYALTDLSAVWLIQNLDRLGVAHSALVATCLTYVFSGLIGLLLGIRVGQDLRMTHLWTSALYFSIPFFLADICIFTTFRLVGPVFGNILLSTRGMISILLAKVIAQKNLLYLEQQVTTAVTIRRLLAASLFTLAIALYVIGQSA